VQGNLESQQKATKDVLKGRNKIHHKRCSRISHLHISSSLCSKSVWAHKPLFLCAPLSPPLSNGFIRALEVGIDWEEIQHFGTHKLKQQQQQQQQE
jgi:hypothetical protein